MRGSVNPYASPAVERCMLNRLAVSEKASRRFGRPCVVVLLGLWVVAVSMWVPRVGHACAALLFAVWLMCFIWLIANVRKVEQVVRIRKRLGVFATGIIVMACAATAYGQKQPQLMSPDKEAALRASIPPIDNDELAAKLAEATLYTADEMPPAMQAQSLSGDRGEGVTHFESIYVSKNNNDRRGLFTNPNREFPWEHPGGTDRNHDVQKTFKAFWLPKKPDGSRWPVIIYRENLERSNAVNMPSPVGYRWLFPKGTVFFEVLTMQFSDRYLYTWELRAREREEDDWHVDVYRPFPSKQHLIKRIRELRGSKHPAIAALEQPRRLQRLTLQDSRHPRRAFAERGAEYVLPKIESKLVRELLTTTTFTSALGEEWDRDGLAVAYAPTTKERIESIVPPEYLGSFIRTDSIGCASCHKTTLRPADAFENRDWYERARGDDGIFSWHPVSLQSIGRANAARRPVQYRPEFEQAGLIEKYNPDQHPKTMYQRAPEFDNSARSRDTKINPYRQIIGG